MADGETGPKRLTVNAAFLRDIKDDNRQLKSLFEELSGLITHPTITFNHWQEFLQRLADLRDQLAFHFSLEEAYGYFDAAIDAEPHLSVQAESLRGEHPKLFSALLDLIDRAAETPADRDGHVESVLRAYREFHEQFMRHEEAEVKLILHALEDDIGGGD